MEHTGQLLTLTTVLVAPSPLAPEGFVNVATGETHPIVW
jgi:adenine deaminase